MEHIKGIHIAIILSVVVHGAFLLKLGGPASAGKRPMTKASPVIYVQANVAAMNEPDQPETEHQPEPKPLVKPDNTSESEPPQQTREKRIAKRGKTAKPSSTATQPAAPLQHASIASVIKTRQSYILQVLERIEEQKSYPLQARRRRTSGSVTLSIRVNSTGVIEKLECMQGPASLCQAAVNATVKAQPFPLLPEGTNHLAFEYQMLYKLY